MNRILLSGAVLGFLSVVAGALSDHGPLARLDPESMTAVATAIRYHQLGALMVSALGLVLFAAPDADAGRWLVRTGWLFVAGTVLFSFSIYAAALTGIDGLTWITPVGGVTLMIAWLALARAALGGGSR